MQLQARHRGWQQWCLDFDFAPPVFSCTQEHGHVSSLPACLIAQGVAYQMQAAVLTVQTGNAAAVRFYRKLGYVKATHSPSAKGGEGYLILTKQLPTSLEQER